MIEVASIARCPHPKVKQDANDPSKGQCEACGKAMVRKMEWRYAGTAICGIDAGGEGEI